MTTEPTPTDLDFLDFRPGCLDGEDGCHNTATHQGRSRCCSESVLIVCQQCRREPYTERAAWSCGRCGEQWERRADAFDWEELLP